MAVALNTRRYSRIRLTRNWVSATRGQGAIRA